MQGCMLMLTQRGFPIDPKVLKELDVADRALERKLRSEGLRRTNAKLKCCPGIGPRLLGEGTRG